MGPPLWCLSQVRSQFSDFDEMASRACASCANSYKKWVLFDSMGRDEYLSKGVEGGLKPGDIPLRIPRSIQRSLCRDMKPEAFAPRDSPGVRQTF